MPILLSDTVLVRYKDGTCWIAGFHFALASRNGSGGPPVQTGIWASWLTPNSLHPESERVHVLSHEVAEWIGDPLVNNRIPPTDFVDPLHGC